MRRTLWVSIIMLIILVVAGVQVVNRLPPTRQPVQADSHLTAADFASPANARSDVACPHRCFTRWQMDCGAVQEPQ